MNVKLKKIYLSLAAALCFAMLPLSALPQTTSMLYGNFRNIFTQLSATGATAPFSMVTTGIPANYTVQPFVTGSPATCSFHVYGSAKFKSESPSFPSDYADLSGAIDCSSAGPGIVHIAYKPVATLIISLTTLTGGTSPSVTFYLIGKQ